MVVVVMFCATTGGGGGGGGHYVIGQECTQLGSMVNFGPNKGKVKWSWLLVEDKKKLHMQLARWWLDHFGRFSSLPLDLVMLPAITCECGPFLYFTCCRKSTRLCMCVCVD